MLADDFAPNLGGYCKRIFDLCIVDGEQVSVLFGDGPYFCMAMGLHVQAPFIWPNKAISIQMSVR